MAQAAGDTPPIRGVVTLPPDVGSALNSAASVASGVTTRLVLGRGTAFLLDTVLAVGAELREQPVDADSAALREAVAQHLAPRTARRHKRPLIGAARALLERFFTKMWPGRRAAGM